MQHSSVSTYEAWTPFNRLSREAGSGSIYSPGARSWVLITMAIFRYSCGLSEMEKWHTESSTEDRGRIEGNMGDPPVVVFTGIGKGQCPLIVGRRHGFSIDARGRAPDGKNVGKIRPVLKVKSRTTLNSLKFSISIVSLISPAINRSLLMLIVVLSTSLSFAVISSGLVSTVVDVNFSRRSTIFPSGAGR